MDTLYDKNNVEIKKDDIIRMWDPTFKEYEVGRVLYEDGRWGVSLQLPKRLRVNPGFSDFLSLGHQQKVSAVGWEVIGNIKENPELLET